MTGKPSYVIKIDQGKCRDASNCRICVDNCPGAVFTMYTVKGHFFDENAEWRVVGSFISLCTGCRACQRDCPNGAIFNCN